VSGVERPDLKAAAAPTLLERGCVHVIGLEPLRHRAGARWEKIREGVHCRLEIILRKRLGPSDFFLPLDETSYLVTMPGAEGPDAQTACLGAAYELYESYLGECDIGSIMLYRAKKSADEGIAVDRVKIIGFIIAGVCAALTGILLASSLGSGTPSAADSYLLSAFAAVFLGSAYPLVHAGETEMCARR